MSKKNNLFNTNLVYFLIMTLFVCVRIFTSLGFFDFLGAGESIILTVVIQGGLLFLLPLLLMSKLKKKRLSKTLDDFAVRAINWKTILISIALGIVVFLLTIIISSFFSYILALLGYSQGTSVGTSSDVTWGGFAISMLTVAILPAICEEFTHRGMLISGYKTLGIKRAIIYSGLLFGLLHLNIEQFFYAFIVGCILGAVTLFAKSIVPAIIIHFMNNALNVYFSFASAKSLPGGTWIKSVSEFLISSSWFTTVIFVVLLVSLLMFLLFFLLSAILNINAKRSLQSYAERESIEQMRREVLGDVLEPEQPAKKPLIFFNRNGVRGVTVNIPYEVLGFYITPQIKYSLWDNVFFYGSLVLGGLITIFTFVWGII